MTDENDKPRHRNDNGGVQTPLLTKSVYDIAKDVTTIYIPALATLYAGIASILNLPFSVEVLGIGGLVTVFLGTILKISSTQFQNLPVRYDGALVVNMVNPMKENYSLEIDKPWDELADLKEVRIQVVEES